MESTQHERARVSANFVPPPRGPARVFGGLLGVVGGEAVSPGGFDLEDCEATPATSAMLELATAYAAGGDRGARSPAEVAARHAGVPGLGWLIPAAIAVEGERLAEEVQMLGEAAGVPRHLLSSTVRSFVHVAAMLFCGASPSEALEHAPAQASGDGGPELCGEGIPDSWAAATWAVGHVRRVGDVAAPMMIGRWEPWVAASVGGLLGIRDGCAGLPLPWHQHLAVARCKELVNGLIHARQRDLSIDLFTTPVLTGGAR